MKRSERLLNDAKREWLLAFVCGCAVVAIGSQVEWLAQSGAVLRAFGCVVLVFFLSLGGFVCIGNAIRLHRQAREEREWESGSELNTDP